MALFRFKKDKEKKKEIAPEIPVVSNGTQESGKEVKKEKQKKTPVISSDNINYEKDISAILLRPRITEKSTLQAEKKVFVFDVVPRATKADIKEAIQKVYRVTPLKVNMIKVPSKKVRMKNRNTFGRKSGGKKAFVYLKEGDNIDIV